MTSSMPIPGGESLLHREMRVVFGHVPDSIADARYVGDGLTLGAGEFLFEPVDGLRFHYRRGEGVVAAVSADPEARALYEVYLWGTVFGAVAWYNGFFTLHASAVVIGGRAVAFTADSGEGKSTLAAA